MLKQIYLVCYLESKNCKEVRQSKNGYFVMRNKLNGKISGVPKATADNGFLKEETICNICNTLEVEIPPSSEKDMKKLMESLKKDVQEKINNND